MLSIIGPRPCYDPKHPQSRREDAEAATRILARARDLFGGTQSEGSLDFTAPALDRLLYIDCDKWSPLAKKPYVDVCVPLYQTVLPRVLLYNLSTNVVNSLPGEAGYLRSIEYGGTPLAYFYGHFLLDESKNWLGQRDYRYDDAEGLKQTVAGLRRVYDDLKELGHLQRSFSKGIGNWLTTCSKPPTATANVWSSTTASRPMRSGRGKLFRRWTTCWLSDRMKMTMSQYTTLRPIVFAACLVAMLTTSASWADTATVRQHNGRPALFINGEPVPPFAYMSYLGKERYYREVAEAGIHLYCFPAYLGDRGINPTSGIGPFRPSIWKGEGSYDFSSVEKDFETLLAADPRAQAIVRLHLDPPEWWEKAHPEGCCQLPDGSTFRQCFASSVWREATAKALRAFLNWIQQSSYSEHLIGVHVAAGRTEEWFYHYRGAFHDGTLPGRLRFVTGCARPTTATPTDFVSLGKIRLPNSKRRLQRISAVRGQGRGVTRRHHKGLWIRSGSIRKRSSTTSPTSAESSRRRVIASCWWACSTVTTIS